MLVALVYGLSWLFIRAMLPAVRAEGENLTGAAAEEQAAISSVLQECPEDCRGDLDPSTCVHIENEIGIVENRLSTASRSSDDFS